MEFNQRGFTLIEVLIAITVLAFIALGITTTSENSIATKERVTSEDNQFLEMETVLSRLEWDISHLYSPLYFSIKMQGDNNDGEDAEAYANFMSKYQNNERFNNVSYDALPIPKLKLENKTKLTVFTVGNRRKRVNQRQSNFAWVQYTLEATPDRLLDDEDTENLGQTLVRRVINKDVFNPEALEWDKVRPQMLLNSVTKLIFEFWDPRSKKWRGTLGEVRDGRNKIYGLKLTIEQSYSQDNKRQMVKVFRPLFPPFVPEDMYRLRQTKDEEFLQSTGSSRGEVDGA